MKKIIFLLLPLTLFSPLVSQEKEQPSFFEALEMLIQEASKPGQEEVSDTGESEEASQKDPVLRLVEFEG